MHKHLLKVAALLLFLTGSALVSYAEDRSLTGKTPYCDQIKKDIGIGIDAKLVTRDKIREGHDACPVIRCAIFSGGQPQRVIAGAREAGTGSEQVSRCAVDACAEANRFFDNSNTTCSIMKSDIARGMDPRKVVRDRIRGGNDACSAIKCAIASGTDLRQVFAAAKRLASPQTLLPGALSMPALIPRGLQQSNRRSAYTALDTPTMMKTSSR